MGWGGEVGVSMRVFCETGRGGGCVWRGVCNTCTSLVRLFKIVENYTMIQQ